MRALTNVVGLCGLGLGLLALTGSESRAVDNAQVRPQMPRGVEVLQVFRDSPADGAGLERGDIIVEVNGTAIRDFNHLRNTLARSRGMVELTVLDVRTGQMTTMEVTPWRGTIGIRGRTAGNVTGPAGSQGDG